jgi:hypothetical protein
MARTPERDESARDVWRAALPGVPDEAITLPRYHAKGYNFPPANLHGSDAPELWWWVRGFADAFVLHLGTAPQLGKGPDRYLRRQTKNTLDRAARWWNGLDEIDTLRLNQSLYARRDKWKDIQDLPEFLACLTLCWIWITLPADRRSKSETLRLTRQHFRDAIDRFENGTFSAPSWPPGMDSGQAS